jgi:predicted negative regulator of RcsB-dependent stress response
MSSYDLEEQEQLAKLKAFWNDNGTAIMAAVTAVLVALAGWRLWGWYQVSQATQASAIYSELQKAAGAADQKRVRELAGTLLESHPRSIYASFAALVSAKAHFEAGDLKTARAQLQWVIDKAADPEVRAVARLRLAAVLLDEKAYDEALAVLAAKDQPAAFGALFDEARGDVLRAQGKPAEARAAYQAALGKLASGDAPGRELIQLKLDAVGG